MRQTILAATAAFVIGGLTTGAVLSQAQPAPPPIDRPGPESDMTGGPHHGMGWGHHPRPGFGMRALGLIYRQPDRQLAAADVQKIAEAFLLWNGNHTWKVSDVATTADNQIGFNLTTPEGSVVAKFSMDPHTGRITRLG